VGQSTGVGTAFAPASAIITSIGNAAGQGQANAVSKIPEIITIEFIAQKLPTPQITGQRTSSVAFTARKASSPDRIAQAHSP